MENNTAKNLAVALAFTIASLPFASKYGIAGYVHFDGEVMKKEQMLEEFKRANTCKKISAERKDCYFSEEGCMEWKRMICYPDELESLVRVRRDLDARKQLSPVYSMAKDAGF